MAIDVIWSSKIRGEDESVSNKNDKKTEELITQELNRNTEIMTEEISTKHRKWKRWYKVVGALACVVVFCTTYLLVLPVITMEKPTYCGYETHTHTAECYLEESQLICGSEEQIGHAHASECYNELEELVCGQAESEGHEHTEECYTTNSTLVCSMEEHNHRIQCQSDYEADVETLEQWEQTLPNKDDLKDKTISERISLVAKSQTGYSESRDNFIVLDDDAETISGYTRYGEWYNGVKDPSDITDYRYKEWPSLFTLFCLNYGGVAIKDIDWNIDYNQWIPDLMNNHPELLQETTTYNPVVGDVVFIHNQDDTYKSGVITEISANQITVLSGDQKENGQDKVKAFKLSLSDENIVFYLSFAEASEESENYEELESKKNDIQSEVSEEKDCIEEITPKDLKIGGNWIEDSYDSVAMTKAGRSSQHYDTSIAMMSVKESVPVDASQYLTGYTVKWHEVHDSSVTGSLPWKELKENEPIPANAHLRFEMQYGNLSPKAVQAGNYKMVLKIDSYIKNLMASGNILMAGEPRGTITATENEIILEFDHDWIDALVANNNKVSDDNKQSILGDFYF